MGVFFQNKVLLYQPFTPPLDLSPENGLCCMVQAIHLMRGIVLNGSYIVKFGLLLAINCMCKMGVFYKNEVLLYQPFTPVLDLSLHVSIAMHVRST